MGKTLVINGADFSNVALGNTFNWINTDSLEKFECSQGDGFWFKETDTSKDDQQHVLYNVEGKSKVNLMVVSKTSPSAFYGFLNSNHAEPVVSNQTTEYCEGQNRIGVTNVGEVLSIGIPGDAKYIVFTTIDGANNPAVFNFSVE